VMRLIVGDDCDDDYHRVGTFLKKSAAADA
jgi:hypothetical protein